LEAVLIGCSLDVMAIVIDDENVLRLLRDEAARTGESFDEIIIRVRRERLDELDREERETLGEVCSPPM
jgi:hypothetical protein